MTTGFVHRHGTTIHDIHDNPFTLRGVGIGGWLLPEGYMLKSFGAIDRPRRFRSHLSKMVGPAATNAFFASWYQTFFTEWDVRRIKQAGFNSIRIAIDYAFLFEPSETAITLAIIPGHFTILDRIVRSCATEEVYVILDLHAAPGGQTGTNIDNSVSDHPDLFTNELYQQQLLHVWRTIALRYKDEPWIAAYDLLNEPLPKWQAKYNDLLMPLYRRVIQSIRTVDPHHMITIEGLHWATDWSCFTELPDDNILLQFHKYWSNPDKESLAPYLETREQLQVPIFMGEGGENNLPWYYAVFKLYDQLDISFNFWTYKKMDTSNSIVSFAEPSNWPAFLEGTLATDEARIVLEELLHGIQPEQVTWNDNVVNHILQLNNLIIPAHAYDHFGDQTSHHAIRSHDSSMRISDGMRLVARDHRVVTPNFRHYGGECPSTDERITLILAPGEWVIYGFYLTPPHRLDDVKVIGVNDTEPDVTLEVFPPTASMQPWRVRVGATEHDAQVEFIHVVSRRN